MKRLLLTVSYDGTAYHGWQVQPNGVTVQEVIQDALSEMLQKKTCVTGCSRTDAGVHAKEFCFHIDCDNEIPNIAFTKGLSSRLPDDISVLDCIEVSDDFHARYSAKGKTYAYYILNNSTKDPFLSRYSWKIDQTLDIDKMNVFCKNIVGTHDFYAFSSSGRSVEDTVRTITECYVEKQGDMVVLKVSANGFLYNMVRIIVGTAVGVSQGRINPDDFPEILKEKRRECAGMTAPAKALFLEKVIY